MFNTLPFPNTNARDADERSRQTIDYLLQFREELVFILDNIVSGQYGGVKPSTTNHVYESADNSLTVAEVVNSAMFKAAISGFTHSIVFHVNFETGNLEYEIKKED